MAENDRRETIDFELASGEEINRLIAQGVRRALAEHKRAGRSIVVWDRERDRIVTVPPEQIMIPEDGPEATGTR